MLHEVDRWVKTGKVDEVQVGSDQLRYTPKAIRRMAFAISSAFGDIADPSKPFNFPWKWEASLYLLMTGFMEHSELRDFFLTPGSVIKRERLPSKHIAPNTDSRVRNVVLGSVESAAEAVDIIRSETTEAIVIFDHGKWNGIPHAGYIAGWLGIMNMLRGKKIAEPNVVWVRACDTNTDIRDAGSAPFLNTHWRKSLNSYLPLDVVCSSGDFDMKHADDYWAEAYRKIKPDYLVAVRGDSNTQKKFKRLKKMGMDTQILLRPRLGDEAVWDVSVSQRGLRKFDWDLPLGMGSRQFVAAQYQGGAFDRKANWRKYLEDRGFFT